MKNNTSRSLPPVFATPVFPRIQTVPDKGWFTIPRLYRSLEPFFTREWRPGEMEPVL